MSLLQRSLGGVDLTVFVQQARFHMLRCNGFCLLFVVKERVAIHNRLYVAKVTCAARRCAGKRVHIFEVATGCIYTSCVLNGCITVHSSAMGCMAVSRQMRCNFLRFGTFLCCGRCAAKLARCIP
jgi:hypothetical protein